MTELVSGLEWLLSLLATESTATTYFVGQGSCFWHTKFCSLSVSFRITEQRTGLASKSIEIFRMSFCQRGLAISQFPPIAFSCYLTNERHIDFGGEGSFLPHQKRSSPLQTCSYPRVCSPIRESQNKHRLQATHPTGNVDIAKMWLFGTSFTRCCSA